MLLLTILFCLLFRTASATIWRAPKQNTNTWLRIKTPTNYKCLPKSDFKIQSFSITTNQSHHNCSKLCNDQPGTCNGFTWALDGKCSLHKTLPDQATPDIGAPVITCVHRRAMNAHACPSLYAKDDEEEMEPFKQMQDQSRTVYPMQTFEAASSSPFLKSALKKEVSTPRGVAVRYARWAAENDVIMLSRLEPNMSPDMDVSSDSSSSFVQDHHNSILGSKSDETNAINDSVPRNILFIKSEETDGARNNDDSSDSTITNHVGFSFWHFFGCGGLENLLPRQTPSTRTAHPRRHLTRHLNGNDDIFL